jgi:hypothetical protein
MLYQIYKRQKIIEENNIENKYVFIEGYNIVNLFSMINI